MADVRRRLRIAQFLEYNRDGAFKNLLAAEEHLRYARPGTTGAEAACIIKHLAEVESHCDEAISHAAELGYDEEVELWRQLRDRARELRYRIMLHGVPRPEDAIREVRAMRQLLESFNPELSAMGCAVCGVVEERLSGGGQGVREARVTQPPAWAPEPNPEGLNRGSSENPGGGAMATLGEVLTIYAGEHVGKGILRALKEIDLMLGTAANPPLQRVTTIASIGAGVALPLIAMSGRVRRPWDIFLVLVGGYLSTVLWDVVEEMTAGGTATAGLALAPRVYYVAPPAATAPAATTPVAQTEAKAV